MHPMKLTLEEIYAGKTTKIAVNRERICAPCEGRGGAEGAIVSCPKCKGRGQVIRMQQLGPGMYTQSQGACDDCRGKGEIIDEKKKCKVCQGKKVCKEKKILEAAIDKGTPNNYQYKFHGEADEFPGMEAGDVIIVAQEQPHKRFKRKGADLLMEKDITLVEALTGVDFTFTHLDGTKIRVKNKPGEVIKPEDLKTLEGKGLPFHKKTWENGNLFIIFKVTFPATLKQAQIKVLDEALGKVLPDDDDMAGDAETVMLTKFDKAQENTHA